MKKLIRSKATRSFLTKDGRWTQRIPEAWQISDVIQAVQATAQLNVDDLEIYYSFNEEETSEWDFTVPFGPSLNQTPLEHLRSRGPEHSQKMRNSSN